MALKRMDNVGIVVEDLAATIDFFGELGLELEGRATIEGEWAGRVTGLGDQRVEMLLGSIAAEDFRRASRRSILRAWPIVHLESGHQTHPWPEPAVDDDASSGR